MTDRTRWTLTETGIHTHPWCGTVAPDEQRGRDGKPTRYVWTDRRRRVRGSFASAALAKLAARRLSGVQREAVE